MAATMEARRLTEAHRLSQARLGAQTVQQMRSAWRLFDPSDIDASLDRWFRVTLPIVRTQRRTSARLAGNYLRAFKVLEIGESTVPLQLAETVEEQAVVTSLTVTGPASVKSAMSRGVSLVRAAETAEARTAATAMRHVLNGGRETIVNTVRAARRAAGWARTTSGRACHFCSMLASRGAVYRERSVDFEAHDHCSCGAEPIYRDDAALPPGNERLRDLWQESTRGLSGAEARNAFRKALDAA